MTRVVAIHQPNFLPWLAYYDKLARADVFILLDDAQFPKKQGNWTNRVRVLVNGRPSYLTVPIVRAYHGLRQIREVTIDESRPWRRKLSRTIEESYAGAAFFRAVAPVVMEALSTPTDKLADLNEAAIRRFATQLRLDPGKLVRSSSLGVHSTGTQRLIALTEAVGGTAYLSGGGAAGYQEDARFGEAGIELVRQRFEHPVHCQHSNRYVEGLSIVDALMHCGWTGTRELLGRSH